MLPPALAAPETIPKPLVNGDDSPIRTQGDLLERLEQLELALARIDQPDFGTCVMCRQPIAPARLAYLPDSTLCVQCASR